MNPWWLLLIIPGALIVGALGLLAFGMYKFWKGMNW